MENQFSATATAQAMTQGNGMASATATAGTQGGGQANEQLSASFDKAMEKATKTLEITTEKGADLYALKQSVR